MYTSTFLKCAENKKIFNTGNILHLLHRYRNVNKIYAGGKTVMNGNNSIIWLIIILALLGGNNGIGSIFGGNGCGGSDNTWLIILIILLFFGCGNNGFNLCDNNCN